MSETLKSYLELLEIHHLKTTPYTPRSNGAVERMHATLGSILTKLCAGHRSHWAKYLHQALFACNIRIHEVTGFSPFDLVHGCHPRLTDQELPQFPPGSFDLSKPTDVASVTATELAHLNQNRAAALYRLQAQASRMKVRYDTANNATNPRFVPGDVVKMKHHDHTKFQFKWTGPYYIVGADVLHSKA